MTTRKLERSEWRRYLDGVSQNLEAENVDIHVEGLDIGDQLEVEHMPLLGLAYDPDGNTVEIAGENIDHLISDPREIYIDEQDGRLNSIEVIDGNGHRQIVQLTRALELPV